MNEEKLVRDRFEVRGGNRSAPIVRVARSDAEFRRVLDLKLIEEVQEFLVSKDPTEAGDVLDTFYKILDEYGISREDIEKRRVEKMDRYGGFDQRLILINSEK